ncbi:MAG TPA: hypothetical protein VM387_01010, partial [Gemmatimonadales bacterium]|nr:hypothetical protein [Gemmatimonadales bacterium]
TSFRRYDPTPENEARAFRLVEEMNRLETGGEVVESLVGRPSAERAGKDEGGTPAATPVEGGTQGGTPDAGGDVRPAA